MTEPEFIIQTSALGILAFSSFRMFTFLGAMRVSLENMARAMGRLEGLMITQENRSKRNGRKKEA